MGVEVRLVVLSAVSPSRMVDTGGSATLARRLGVPAPALLDAGGRPFAQRWNELALEWTGFSAVFLVANSHEARELRESIPMDSLGAEIEVDRGQFRGTAGSLRDLAGDLSAARPCRGMVVIEASTPPLAAAADAAHALVARWRSDAGSRAAVGVDSRGLPIGVAAVPLSDLGLVATVGYQDLKEQFLPALHAAGRGAEVVRFAGIAPSLRSREQYLSVVGQGRSTPFIDSSAAVSDAADIRDASVIGAGASVADGAVILGSVIMPGARIGRGAVVARSIVGPRAVVGAGEFLADDVAAAAGAVP